jgi:hypothetical protein
MATPLDIGLLKVFELIFPFIFIITAGYAVLSNIDPFKKNPFYAAVTAAVFAIMTLASPIAMKTINTMAPFFVMLFIFAIFIMIAYGIFGYTDEEGGMIKAITDGGYKKTIGFTILVLVLIIGIGSFASVVSQEKGFTGLTADGQDTTGALQAGDSEESSFFKTILHPKVLGLAVLLVIGYYTIDQLTNPSD